MLRRGATLGAGLFAGFLASSALSPRLPNELRQTVLTAVKTGGKGVAASASVLVLVEGGMRMVTGAKILLWSVVAVTVSGLLAGVAWETALAMRAEGPSAPTPSQLIAAKRADFLKPAERVADVLGDPLPEGAVARLGTRRMCGPTEPRWAAFSPDGTKVASSDFATVTVWDAATGREPRGAKGNLRPRYRLEERRHRSGHR